MGILRVSQLNKAFGIEELFHDVSFEISVEIKLVLLVQMVREKYVDALFNGVRGG